MELEKNMLLKSQEAAEILGISDSTLRKWRSKEVGPPYFKIGKTVKYYTKDLSNFLDQARREHTKNV